MTEIKIKRILTIGFIGTVLILWACSCTKKSDIAQKQSNGLHYQFIDYIGPDSAMLYSCAYQAPNSSDAGAVFLTVPRHKNDPQTSVSWTVQSGKTTQSISNQVQNVPPSFGAIDTSYMQVTNKLVPETVMVVRFKK